METRSHINGISIITPTYHSAKMLNGTMRSIMQQQQCNFEWIVIAGDQSEETQTVLAAYGRDQLVVEYRTPKGIYDAVRAGFKKAKYDIIYWINAGDIMMPYAFNAIFTESLDQSKSCWTGRASLRNEDIHLIRVDPLNRYDSKFIKLGFYGKHMPWLQQESIFFRRELLTLVDLDRFSKFRYAGDYFLFYSFAKQGIKIVSFNYVLASFTRHAGQVSENQKRYWDEVESFTGKYTRNLLSHPIDAIRSIFSVIKFFYNRILP
jgi:glycosyltransferase involved in cell wall biosynthesis